MPPIIAAGIGAAASGASSGKSGKGKGGKPAGQTVTTTTPTPWAPQAGAYTKLYDAAQGALGSGDPHALGAGTVPLSGETNTALQKIGNIASIGSSAVGDANSFLKQLIGGNFNNASLAPSFGGLAATAGGAYLPGRMPAVSGNAIGTSVSGSGNPYLDNLMTQAAQQAQGATNSSFNAAGRFGGGTNVGTLQSNVLDATARTFSPIYQQERSLQQQAQGLLGQAQLQGTQLSPALDQAQYIDPSMLQSVGQFYDARNLANANASYDAFKNYAGLIGGSPMGGGGSVAQPFYTNPLANVLGGALGGASLANQLGLGGSSSPGGLGSKGGKGYNTGGLNPVNAGNAQNGFF